MTLIYWKSVIEKHPQWQIVVFDWGNNNLFIINFQKILQQKGFCVYKFFKIDKFIILKSLVLYVPPYTQFTIFDKYWLEIIVSIVPRTHKQRPGLILVLFLFFVCDHVSPENVFINIFKENNLMITGFSKRVNYFFA